MANCPDYLAIWLGITRAGGIVALVNPNLTGASLAHAVNIAGPKHLIFGAKFEGSVIGVHPLLLNRPSCWVYGKGHHDFPQIDLESARFSAKKLEQSEAELPLATDRALYIYTSGTTGLPKAAILDHFRLMQWAYWFAGLMNTRATDRLYNPLPMCHSIGGVVAIGSVLVNGGSVVLPERFSTSRFWDDIVNWDCTLFPYIGELCRYLVNSPSHPKETAHRVRLCCGNGLRGDVWEAFVRRFGIPQILEFYAATEGNVSLYNCDGKRGAIGRIPAFLAHRFPIALIQLDTANKAPLRDRNGYCLRCGVDEVGEAIGEIRDESGNLGNRFLGYTDPEASSRKVLKNVFVAGDRWFRTGDLMRRDRRGYFYFFDRIGDTFRWKGENISTTEVATVIEGASGVSEAVVYGVSIPGSEGRAGMAAIVVAEDLNLGLLRRYIHENLPKHARPLFLRIRTALDITATFKPRTQDLRQEGYDPRTITDRIYFDDNALGAYVPLSFPLYSRIQSGRSHAHTA